MIPDPPGDHGDRPPDAADGAERLQRVEFLADAPERVRELSAALGTLRARDPSGLEALRRVFQELSASAASHGLADIAARCAAGQAAAAALAGAPLPLPRTDLQALERHVLGAVEGLRLAQRRLSDPGTR